MRRLVVVIVLGRNGALVVLDKGREEVIHRILQGVVIGADNVQLGADQANNVVARIIQTRTDKLLIDLLGFRTAVDNADDDLILRLSALGGRRDLRSGAGHNGLSKLQSGRQILLVTHQREGELKVSDRLD